MELPAAGIPLSQCYFVSCKILIPQNSFNPYAVPDIGVLYNLSASMYTNPPEMVFPGCGEQKKGNKHFFSLDGTKIPRV
jgi:hypothetical protein